MGWQNEMVLDAALRLFMSTPWLYWGAGPTLSAIVGFMSVAMFCEWAVRQPWAQSSLIVYSDEGNRLQDVAKTQSVVSAEEQRNTTLWTVAGPTNILSAIAVRYIFPLVVPEPTTLLPSLVQFLCHFVLLALIADFGLYWGHRIQHENAWLWEHCHRYCRGMFRARKDVCCSNQFRQRSSSFAHSHLLEHCLH